MDLALGPRYEQLRLEVRQFLAAHADSAPRGSIALPGGGATGRLLDWQRLLVSHGYAARTIPREYGGYGAAPDPLEKIVIDEEFARQGASRGVGGQGPDMLVPTLLEHGSESQKRRYIEPTILGQITWCQGYSEPGAGSDLANVQTRAEVDGESFVITGQKIWTTSAHQAQMMFALVRSEPDAAKHAGLSYVLIPMDAPGIEVRPLGTMTGRAEFNQVFFDQVRVPLENLVGRRGEGWRIANTTLVHERNFLASSAQLEGAFERFAELLKREELGGRRLADDPLLRDRACELEARVIAMKAHSLRLLTCRLEGRSAGLAGLVSKLTGCQLSHDIAAAAIDALMELGPLYDGSPHERSGGAWPFHYMFSLGLIIGGGTAQIQKNIISERGLGMPRGSQGSAK